MSLFQNLKKWKKKTGQTVEFQESYVASGAQATAIIQGFEADIAPLSLEGDIQKIAEKGLITHDWKNNPYKGISQLPLLQLVFVKAIRKALKTGLI